MGRGGGGGGGRGGGGGGGGKGRSSSAKSSSSSAKSKGKGRDAAAESTLPTTVLSPARFRGVRNKAKRSEVFARVAREQRRKRTRARRERRRVEEELGDKAPPKPVPNTLERSRVPDETVVVVEAPAADGGGGGGDAAAAAAATGGLDPEVAAEEEQDEFAGYYVRGETPRVLLTTETRRPTAATHRVIEELLEVIPGSRTVSRDGDSLKEQILPWAVKHGFTDVLLVAETRKQPDRITMVHLPDGPTLWFRLTSWLPGARIPGHGRRTDAPPELIMNNFNTRLGRIVGRQLAALFPHVPHFGARQVVTWHNQRDFVFFREHRYIFESAQKARLQELGPRFTLRLVRAQAGTFDTRYGEVMWERAAAEHEAKARPGEALNARRRFAL